MRAPATGGEEVPIVIALCRRAGRVLAAGSLLLVTGVAEPTRAQEEATPILVALRPFAAPGQASVPGAEATLRHFVTELGRPQPGARLEVRESFVLPGSVLGFVAGSDPEARLRALAKDSGAPWVVVLGLSPLAGSTSLDLRVLPAGPGLHVLHRVLAAPTEESLPEVLAAGARAVREALATHAAPEPDAPAPLARPALLAQIVAEGEVEATPDVSAGTMRVADVQVVGNRRIEADAIRAVVTTRPGEPYRPARIAEDVRRIYELGYFRDVQVLAGESLEGKIVTFIVEENPLIRQVTIAGNESIDAEEIRDQLTLTVGSTIDYPLLLENKARLEAFYAVKGFYLAQIEYEVETLREGAVAVNFLVEEGRKIRLVEIDFVGNEHLDDGDLHRVIETKPWGWLSYVTHFWDHSGLYAEPLFYQDLDRISRRYMDEGFIRAEVGDPQVEIEEDGLSVTVEIVEGERYSVGSVDVAGDATMDRDQLLGLTRLAPGEIFRRSTLTDDVERLQTHYADRGFFFAKVSPRTRVDPEALRVDCLFEVEKGDLYFVDRIDVHGNTRTRDQVVRRELSVAEGELYSAAALQRSKARVRRLGFFEEVTLEPRPLDEPHRVGVDVEVVERPTGTFSFGAGVGSTDGFLVNASIRQENLLGKGYGLVANADVGSRAQTMFLRFSNPYAFGTNASYSTTISRTEREFLDFDNEILGFDFTVGYPLDEGETRAFTGYSFTSRDVTGLDVQAASLLQREEFQGDTTTSLASISFRRDTRDDPRFPKRGQLTGLALEFAGLGGLSQFLRVEGRTTWFKPVKRWLPFESTFVFNARFGWVIPFNSISDFDLPGCVGADCQAIVALNPSQIQPLTNIDTDLELPLSERYFLGGLGAFQVRGFQQRSLGPRRTILDQQFNFANPGDRVFFPSSLLIDPVTGETSCRDGPGSCNNLFDTDIDDFDNLDLADVIGGNKFLLLNFELQFPLSEELGLTGILFFDMGNAFAEDEAMNPADFRFGTGAGVQWFSPFGPILVQLGFPLDALEDEDGSVFEFSLGGAQY